MQVNETLAEGLKRELSVTIPATDLDTRLAARLEEMRGRARINGFRPGKVPVAHLRKVYGKAAMAEIVETLVGESSRKVLDDRGEKAAMQPKIAMTEDESEATKILDGKADLTFTLEYEVLPEFEVADFKGIQIERPIADIPDEDVEDRLQQIASSSRSYETVDRQAQDGDRVTLSYLGKVNGEPFEGGADENGQIVLGSGGFIPGFEDAILGLRAGDEKTIDVTFPENYQGTHLAGKPATFDIKVKEVAEPGDVTFDDEFAKRLGLESMEKLRETVRAQVQTEFGTATRQKVKRQLLDALDTKYSFPLPGNLVEQEFDNIWRQVSHDVEHHGKSFESEGTTEEEARAEYRKIAERRVRLGLVLSRVGEAAEVNVTDEELQRALYDTMRRYPGQEKQVFDFYRSNPQAMQTLRAPIFEEKVVDYMLELADVTDKTVAKDELFADTEEDDFGEHHHHHHHDEPAEAGQDHDHAGHDHAGHAHGDHSHA